MQFLKKFLSIILALTLSSLPVLAISSKKLSKLQQQQHKAMHEIVMVERDASGDIVSAGLCTAYAVGPHTLMTAEHCNSADTDDIYVDPVSREAIHSGEVHPFPIISRQFDHEDHMLVDIKGINFKDAIYLGPSVRLPIQGEHTYEWGCPAGIRDQYREGLVTGTMPIAGINMGEGEDKVDATGPNLYIVQTTVVGGDSGSAVFSANDGQLIGVVTFGIDNGALMGMFPITFTGSQIEASMK